METVEEQLAALGVEELTPEEVEEKFINTGEVVPYVSVPASSSVTWMSSRQTYTYNGVRYEIQTLTAQPSTNRTSCLTTKGNRDVNYNYQVTAGLVNMVSTGATALVSSAVKNISGANIALTVYDAIKGFASGVSRTSKVSVSDATYRYTHATTVTFKYVKKVGQSDDKQCLSYISNKGITALTCTYSFYISTTGRVEPRNGHTDCMVYSTPSGYNSDANAVKAYLDPYAPSRVFVNNIKIKGINDILLFNIAPVSPEFPGQIY